MEKLRDFFAKIGFTDDDLAVILRSFVPKEIQKNDYFVEEGRTNAYLGFVESGFFQYYVFSDGEEVTTYTVSEGGFIVSLNSFFKQIPARENIRAVTNSKIWVIHKLQLRQLQLQFPAFQDFYVGLLEWQIGCIDDSRLDFIVLNAEQRYEKLLREEPHLLQQIPLQHLAAMLGVTPRHLSRIRKNIR
jgi:CRP/FNR family transcriptional regulator, anaerobic regulatory protein